MNIYIYYVFFILISILWLFYNKKFYVYLIMSTIFILLLYSNMNFYTPLLIITVIFSLSTYKINNKKNISYKNLFYILPIMYLLFTRFERLKDYNISKNNISMNNIFIAILASCTILLINLVFIYKQKEDTNAE